MLTKSVKRELIIASAFFALAVALGAFGAHGLKAHLSDKAIKTYQTGVDYQFLHAIALFIASYIGFQFKIRIQQTYWAFVAGIIFFSFNCYFYAVTGVKTFAMIVPIGGVLFLIGWITLIIKLFKSESR